MLCQGIEFLDILTSSSSRFLNSAVCSFIRTVGTIIFLAICADFLRLPCSLEDSFSLPIFLGSFLEWPLFSDFSLFGLQKFSGLLCTLNDF